VGDRGKNLMYYEFLSSAYLHKMFIGGPQMEAR
jgi:hypothetical protein